MEVVSKATTSGMGAAILTCYGTYLEDRSPRRRQPAMQYAQPAQPCSEELDSVTGEHTSILSMAVVARQDVIRFLS